MQQNKKCGTCKFFWVRADKAELAVKAPHISQCQPGMPHCLGGQVRGACQIWQERARMGLPMPWSDGPMVESTFSCKLWQPGGPSIKRMGSYNKKKKDKSSGLVSTVGFLVSMVGLGAIVLNSGGANRKEVYMKIVDLPGAPSVYTTMTEFIQNNDPDMVGEYVDLIAQSNVGDIIPLYAFGDFEMGQPTQIIVISQEEYMDNQPQSPYGMGPEFDLMAAGAAYFREEELISMTIQMAKEKLEKIINYVNGRGFLLKPSEEKSREIAQNILERLRFLEQAPDLIRVFEELKTFGPKIWKERPPVPNGCGPEGRFFLGITPQMIDTMVNPLPRKFKLHPTSIRFFLTNGQLR